jgi:hypothetical protein
MSMTELRDTWLMFQREHRCSVDRMLCNPDLRTNISQWPVRSPTIKTSSASSGQP